jgi:hypothetical protein
MLTRRNVHKDYSSRDRPGDKVFGRISDTSNAENISTVVR